MHAPPPLARLDPSSSGAPSDTVPLLEIEHLQIRFRGEHGQWRPAVRDLSLQLAPAATLGLVGESGSGKSATALALLGLLPARTCQVEATRLHFAGQDLRALSPRDWRTLRGRQIAMVFQDPMSSLNPVFRVGDQIAEVLRLHRGLPRPAALDQARALLHEVRMPEPGRRLRAFPHQLSGGQLQRAMLAMALAGEPRLLIADEPTTALDPTIQRTILDLLAQLRERYDMAILLISHDLQVVGRLADQVVVMRAGEVREQGTAEQVLSRPRDRYTQALLVCRPGLSGVRRRLPQVDDWLGEGAGEAAPAQTAVANVPRPGPDRPPGGPLLEVRELRCHYLLREGWIRRHRIEALQSVSFRLARGETLGVVGESGCGKSTLARCLAGLQAPSGGELRYAGQDLTRPDAPAWKALRARIQIVFQNPYASLNPRFSVADLLEEPMRIHQPAMSPAQRRARCLALLHQVGLKDSDLQRFPHQFSGGQRQRIAIARCLMLDPELLILDEPVSALDLSVQAQVLNLLRDLQQDLGLAYVFIAHDIAVVRHMADRILVMQAGAVVEELDAAQSLDGQARHPCTRALLSAIPDRPA